MTIRPSSRATRMAAVLAHFFCVAACAKGPAGSLPDVAVGPQYDTTHVYLNAADYDTFVDAWTSTFGGKPGQRITANVTPVESSTLLQYVWSPVGNLSTFAFQTPVPHPYGAERTGWLVTDIDKAIAAARAAGAEVIVDKFKDPIGRASCRERVYGLV